MAKDPAFLLYYKDLDNDTADWEPEALGWYIRLLCFQAGNGYIPSSTEEIAQIARVRFSDYEKFVFVWKKRISVKFSDTLSDTLKLENKKLTEIQKNRKQNALKKSIYAVFGNFIKSSELSEKESIFLKSEFRKNQDFNNYEDDDERKKMIIHFLEITLKDFRDRTPKRTQQAIANENAIANEKGKGGTGEKEKVPFESFWDAYDKKIGKKSKIESKWNRLSASDQKKVIAHIPLYKNSQPDKQYRKNPETYLNNEGWKDEIIDSKKTNNGKSGNNDEPKINRQTLSTIEQNLQGW